MFLTVFPPFYVKEQITPFALRSFVFLKSDCERIAQVALYKRATMSNSLPWLFTKEWRERFAQVTPEKWTTRVIRSFSRVNCSLLNKNEPIPQKTDERIPNPESRSMCWSCCTMPVRSNSEPLLDESWSKNGSLGLCTGRGNPDKLPLALEVKLPRDDLQVAWSCRSPSSRHWQPSVFHLKYCL